LRKFSQINSNFFAFELGLVVNGENSSNQTEEAVVLAHKRVIGIMSAIDDADKNGSVERLIVNIIGKAFNVLGDFYKDIYKSVMIENSTDNYVILFNDFAKSLNLSVNADSMSREDMKNFLEKYYADKAAKQLQLSTLETPQKKKKRDAVNDDELDSRKIKELVEKKINKTVITYGKKYKDLITDFAVKFRGISEELVNSIKGSEKNNEK
jgi:hypothetical protein